MGSKLHIERLQSCFLPTWRQKKVRKVNFMNVSMWFHRFRARNRQYFNIEYWQGSGKNNTSKVQYIVQYLQEMLAILNIHTCRDQKPYIRGPIPQCQSQSGPPAGPNQVLSSERRLLFCIQFLTSESCKQKHDASCN
jgi:hypothetical protein